MKKLYLLLLFFTGIAANAQLIYDSFSDGDFSNSPNWQGSSVSWTIVANSDVAAGAAGSSTLRLNAATVSATDYLSTIPNEWGAYQEWGFFIGRRSQPFTLANQAYFWLCANEPGLNNNTVDGYRIAIGDDSGGDEIRLEYVVNGALQSTVISSAAAIPNGLIDIGILIRVRRSLTGFWELYSSTLPQVNGTGVVATAIPNAAQAGVLQGSAVNNMLVPQNGFYLGVAVLHSSGAAAVSSTEFDQVYFTQSANSTLPVRFLYFNGHREGKNNLLEWATANETNNRGFEIQRSADALHYLTIGFVATAAPAGNSSQLITYNYCDSNGASNRTFYRIRQWDLDDRSDYSTVILINSAATAGSLVQQLFPNPAGKRINLIIHAEKKEVARLYIFDLNGAIRYSNILELEKGNNSASLDLQDWPAGIYILKLLDQNGIQSLKRFIKGP